MFDFASWFAMDFTHDPFARTVFCIAALCTPLVLVLLAGPACIAWLKENFAEPIRTASPRLNALLAGKQSTPTLGGILFLIPFLATCCVVLRDSLAQCGVLALVALGFGLLGLHDDWIKLHTARRGISARRKLLVQVVLATITAWWLWRLEFASGVAIERTVPLLGTWTIGVWSWPLFTLLIVALANAINLTDGLDGLAAGCSAWLLAGFATASLMAGAVAQQGTTYAALALLGSVLGFWWFNRHPAQVFMGNTGSSALGALVAVLAILLRQEWMLLLGGAVFAAELASVALQVGYFKWSGRRLFRCAPLHHHFQFLGWTEPAIVRRFCLAAAACTSLAVALSALSTGEAHSGGLAVQMNAKKLSQEARYPREIP